MHRRLKLRCDRESLDSGAKPHLFMFTQTVERI